MLTFSATVDNPMPTTSRALSTAMSVDPHRRTGRASAGRREEDTLPPTRAGPDVERHDAHWRAIPRVIHGRAPQPHGTKPGTPGPNVEGPAANRRTPVPQSCRSRHDGTVHEEVGMRTMRG